MRKIIYENRNNDNENEIQNAYPTNKIITARYTL